MLVFVLVMMTWIIKIMWMINQADETTRSRIHVARRMASQFMTRERLGCKKWYTFQCVLFGTFILLSILPSMTVLWIINLFLRLFSAQPKCTQLVGLATKHFIAFISEIIASPNERSDPPPDGPTRRMRGPE
jgi:hypothetical protein